MGRKRKRVRRGGRTRRKEKMGLIKEFSELRFYKVIGMKKLFPIQEGERRVRKRNQRGRDIQSEVVLREETGGKVGKLRHHKKKSGGTSSSSSEGRKKRDGGGAG